MKPAPIINEERLIVALDLPQPEQAQALVQTLGEHARFYKIGLELFLADGAFALLEWLAARDKKIFLDLKLFDVPATVGRAVARLCGRGISMTTVHGNDAMMRAAAEAATDDDGLDVLAVTVLTSLDRGDLEDLGFACDVEQLVVSRARRALKHGCAGVVASPHEARALREAVGERLLVVTPGIRPVLNNTDDQKRAASPTAAFANGAGYIVVGRPIRDAADPAAAAAAIQKQIAAHFGDGDNA